MDGNMERFLSSHNVYLLLPSPLSLMTAANFSTMLFDVVQG
jgi:hypothetical protein